MTKNRYEVPDQSKMALPVRFSKPPSDVERMRQMIRAEMSQRAFDHGFETFEEADDFDIDDENDPLERFFDSPTPYEADFDFQAPLEPSSDPQATTLPEGSKDPSAAPEQPHTAGAGAAEEGSE